MQDPEKKTEEQAVAEKTEEQVAAEKAEAYRVYKERCRALNEKAREQNPSFVGFDEVEPTVHWSETYVH